MTNVWRCDQPPCNCFDGLTLRLSHSIFTFIYTLAAEKQQLARTTLSPPHNYSLLLPFTFSATWFNDLVYRLDMMRPSLCVAAKVTQAVSICRGSCLSVCVYTAACSSNSVLGCESKLGLGPPKIAPGSPRQVWSTAAMARTGLRRLATHTFYSL